MFLLGYLWHTKAKFKKEDLLYLGIILIPQFWYVYQGPFHLYEQVKTLVFNIRKTTEESLYKDFPNIYMSVSELQKVSFKEAILSCIFNFYLGILGLLGAFLFFILNLRRMLYILPFFGIGLLVFFSGARFAMYLAPFLGIGLGYLFDLLSSNLLPAFGLFVEKEKRMIVTFIIGVIFIIFLGFIQKPAIGYTSYPKIDSFLVKDMIYLKKHTPENSAIWTWWDYGFAFQLYARRATYHDGASQRTPKTYFVARTFSTKNPQEAWNIISFITNYGLAGVSHFLKSGISAKELLKKIKQGKLVKEIKTPVYWVFTKDLIPKFTWINYFGTYNFDTKKGIFESILVPQTCYKITDQVYNCLIFNTKAQIDLNNGIITFPQGTQPIKVIYYKTSYGLKEKKFFDKGYVIELIKTKTGLTGIFLLESDLADTMFNQMYILRKYDPRYFELVYDDFPIMVVYKVKKLPGR
jgi:dolichyl-diphosphooligosaccharide--protein glycosyltransferase